MTRIATVSTAQAPNITYRIIPPTTRDAGASSSDPVSPVLRTMVHNTSDNSVDSKIVILQSR